MSTQSIVEINKDLVCNKINNFLVCEGNLFRNIIDYDIDGKVDYRKINIVLKLENMMKGGNDCDKILKAINKILR